MIEVKMLRTVPVSPNGLIVETWRVGETHHASEEMVDILIDLGAIELVTQAHGAAPENKATTKRGRPRKVKTNG